MVSEDSTSNVIALPVIVLTEIYVHAVANVKDQMESGLLLDVVVSETAAIFELLSGENQALLIRGIPCLVFWPRLRQSYPRARVMVLPLRVLTKTCIPPHRRRTREHISDGPTDNDGRPAYQGEG